MLSPYLQVPHEDSAAKDSAISLCSVFFGYGGTPVLSGIDFTIPHGEVACLLGPSGCGKTTVLRLIAGLESPRRGKVWVGGYCVASAARFVPAEARARIGMVFQDFALFPHLSVEENLLFAGSKRAAVTEILDLVELSHARRSYPQSLSGGEQQRVALARALVVSPRILLLDEPFANLDARLRDRIRDRTLHFIQSRGMSVLLVTHDAEEGMYLSDRLFVMRDGRIVQSGSPEWVYCEPRDAFVASFLGEVNRFSVPVRSGFAVTPFGRFSVSFSSPRAEIVVRPHALRLGGRSGVLGEVMASRMLRSESLIHLSSRDCDGEELHLHARVPGRFLPPRGKALKISVASKDIFVFSEN